VQLPFFDERERISRPAEVDIFVARGTLVTVHRGELKVLSELFAQARADESLRARLMGRGASPLLYDLLNTLMNYCQPIIRRVEHNVRRIEEHLFDSDTPSVLNEIAVVRRDVIALRHILRPQLDVIRELERGNWEFIHEDLNLYWGDIGDRLSQLRAILDEQNDMIGSLSEAIDTLASHRIDGVVRLLTVVTVLTLPLTLLATVFGMNVVLPFAEHRLLFYTLTGSGIALTALLIWYLRQRRWL